MTWFEVVLCGTTLLSFFSLALNLFAGYLEHKILYRGTSVVEKTTKEDHPAPPSEEEIAAFLKRVEEERRAGWDLHVVPGNLASYGAYIGPERMKEKLAWERRMFKNE